MDAVASGGFARRAKSPQRTAKSCGPGAATVASILSGPCWGGNGDKKRRSPGRARSKPSNHCVGKAGMSRLYLSNPCACLFFCTRCCGRSQRPAFPAPFPRRGTTRCKARTNITSRECRRTSSSLRGAKREQSSYLVVTQRWIASRSLSSGARSRRPVARNDGMGCLKTESAVFRQPYRLPGGRAGGGGGGGGSGCLAGVGSSCTWQRDAASVACACGIRPGSAASAFMTIRPVMVGESMIRRSAEVTSSSSGKVGVLGFRHQVEFDHLAPGGAVVDRVIGDFIAGIERHRGVGLAHRHRELDRSARTDRSGRSQPQRPDP